MFLRTLLFISLMATGTAYAQAQSTPSSSGNSISAESPLPTPPKGGDLGTPEDEMRARNEIKIAEKERQENLERAREAAQLGAEIRDSFSKNRIFNNTDIKKLERLEKLARRIRSRAGGEDDKEPLNNIPASLEPALARLVETSEALCKGVEKTPRHVISTTVIDRANELLEIIRFIRTNAR